MKITMSKLDVFQKWLPIKGSNMNLFQLSMGENIILEKVESVTNVGNKIGFKGSLYEFTIFMDSGREISISNENNIPLIKEQEALLKAIQKLK